MRTLITVMLAMGVLAQEAKADPPKPGMLIVEQELLLCSGVQSGRTIARIAKTKGTQAAISWRKALNESWAPGKEFCVQDIVPVATAGNAAYLGSYVDQNVEIKAWLLPVTKGKNVAYAYWEEVPMAKGADESHIVPDADYDFNPYTGKLEWQRL